LRFFLLAELLLQLAEAACQGPKGGGYRQNAGDPEAETAHSLFLDLGTRGAYLSACLISNQKDK